MIGTKTITGRRRKVAGPEARTKMTIGKRQKVAGPKARTGNRHCMHMAKVGAKIVGAKAHTKMHGPRTRSKTGLTRRHRKVIILIRGSNGIMRTSSGNDKGNGQYSKALDGISRLDK